MVCKFLCVVVMMAVISRAWAGPTPLRREDDPPYAVPLSDLTSRIHLPRLQGQDRPSLLPGQERLPLPTPQELEAIKKVAQILVMLGEQVIPAIINEPITNNCEAVETPNDVVNDN